MKLTNALLASRKSSEEEPVDRRDSCIKYVIDNIHSVHPVFVNSSVPEELHHHEKLGELGDLREDDQADIQAQRWNIVL